MSTRDSTADGAKIAEAVINHLGPQETWIPWPGGYPDRPDLALVDAVMSIRAAMAGRVRTGAPRAWGAPWRATVSTLGKPVQIGWASSLVKTP